MIIRQKKSVFFKIYTIFFLAVILVISIGMFILWISLSDYEKSVPTNILTPIVNNMNNKNYDDLLNNGNLKFSEFETKENLKNYLNKNLTESKFSYSELATSDKNNPVYKIKSGKKEIAAVTLIKTGKKSKFGNAQFQISKISDIGGAEKKIVIYAPSSAKLTLNDKDISNTYIVEKDIAIEDLEYLPKDFAKPTIVKYEISGLFEDGILKATGYLGNQLLISKDEKTGEYTVLSNGTEEMAKSFDELITNASQAYSKYITNDVKLDEIRKYFSTESPLYKTIASMEVNWYTKHEKFEFKNIQTSDFVSYSDNCFSYKIKFDHYVYRIEANKTFHYPCEYTMIFAKKDGKWKVYDIIIHNSTK